MSFLAALKFLTIIRIPTRREASFQELGNSIVFFPVVGIIIGITLTVLNWLLGMVIPTAVVNALLIVWMVIISGGLHLDGLADTCDGIGGQKPVEARLEVMRDSRVGGFGVIGIALLLLVKFVSLNSIPQYALMFTLILMPVISRWLMVYSVFAYPYARPSGLGTVFKKEATWWKFAVATIITLAVVLGLTAWQGIAYSSLGGLVVMGVTWVIIVAVAAYFKRKFAGLTGDTYGAINEIAEVLVLILVTLMTSNRWLGMA